MPKGIYTRTKRLPLEEKSPHWKDDDVGYSGLHKWVYRNFGKAIKCENDESHTSKVFEWANLSGEYKRDRSDWKMLCQSCHRRKDAGNYCKKGHPLFGDNCRIGTTGKRICRACANEWSKENRRLNGDKRRLYERLRDRRIARIRSS